MTRASPTVLALTIYSGATKSDLEFACYDVLSTLLADWSDERKADLYARIVEKTAHMRMPINLRELENHVRAAINENEDELFQ